MHKPRSTAWQAALAVPCEPGRPTLTLVDDDKLAQRQDRHAPRPS
ncbi:hypothetical protein [Streptosporangium subroseum]|nr:hypothetical protein [Streptosporangium subroseum]